jgi:hypothetical protein
MATTVDPATFTATILEHLILDEVEYNYKNVLTIQDVTEKDQRTVNIPMSEITILSFQVDVPGAGTFNETDVRYIRLTNKDDTNFIQITIASETGNESAYKLEKGHSMYIAVSDEGVVNVHDASATALTVSFDDITSVTALADSGTCDLEYLIIGV